MKLKELVILGTIILLLGAYLFLHGKDRFQYTLPEISKVPSKDISRIEISSAGSTIQIAHEDAHWSIGEKRYPADETKISDILSAIEGLQLTALVSEAKAYVRYGLSDDQKITVKAWKDDSLLRTMDIGKEADTYQHTFVRIGDDPNVYQARNNFRQTFEQTQASLRDKAVFSLMPSDIKQIDIDTDGTSISLTLKEISSDVPAEKAPGQNDVAKTKQVWVTGEGEQKKTEDVDRLLSQLTHLTCDHYLEDKKTSDFSNPIRSITLKGEKTITLSIFANQEGETEYPAVSTQNDDPFALNESAWNRMTESVTPFLKAESETAETPAQER